MPTVKFLFERWSQSLIRKYRRCLFILEQVQATEEKMYNQVAESKPDIESKEDLKTITQALVKTTRRTSEQIKPYLAEMVESLMKLEEPPFYETATPEEWAIAFLKWTESHDRNIPLLSDEAVSRESIYGERG